uniref:Uncharacterized protein n=1 Tax=Molossus molossus TaxID=27622 RepID=A0A7J8GQQ8_MOLMO|nr:hypothetical protein HJG59_011374 [Molossus molossus]
MPVAGRRLLTERPGQPAPSSGVPGLPEESRGRLAKEDAFPAGTHSAPPLASGARTPSHQGQSDAGQGSWHSFPNLHDPLIKASFLRAAGRFVKRTLQASHRCFIFLKNCFTARLFPPWDNSRR